LRDVAEFLGDADLIIEAQRRCDAMMQHSRKITNMPEVSSVTTGSTRAIQWEYDLVETFWNSSGRWGGNGWKATPAYPADRAGAPRGAAEGTTGKGFACPIGATSAGSMMRIARPSVT
jgi:hypothetical protein